MATYQNGHFKVQNAYIKKKKKPLGKNPNEFPISNKLEV